MSFDINPLGNQLHLKQLDREAARISRYNKMAASEERQQQNVSARRVGWIRRIMQVMTADGYAN